jgi:glycerol-3-phosphate responsive antiterminator
MDRVGTVVIPGVAFEIADMCKENNNSRLVIGAGLIQNRDQVGSIFILSAFVVSE